MSKSLDFEAAKAISKKISEQFFDYTNENKKEFKELDIDDYIVVVSMALSAIIASFSLLIENNVENPGEKGRISTEYVDDLTKSIKEILNHTINSIKE